jgi:hypothetical protein
MPSREQIERSRDRNRKRFGEASMRSYVEGARKPPTAEDRKRRRREADAGPRFGPKYDVNGNQVAIVDRWGGPNPPPPAA